MKLRFPLYLKLTGWFFLNLLLLGLLALAFVGPQFRLGLDSLLLGAAGERIQAVSEVIVSELAAKPVEDWTEVLQRFDSAYHVDFLVVQLDGTRLAGPVVTLPREVQNRLQEMRGPLFAFGRKGPGFGGPGGRFFERGGGPLNLPPGPLLSDPSKPRPPGEDTVEPGASEPGVPGLKPETRLTRPNSNTWDTTVQREPFFRRPMRDEAFRGSAPGQPPFGARRGFGGPPPNAPPRFLVKTENPTAYWIGTAAPMFELASRVRQPVMLLIHTAAVSGGLFWDPTPWLLYAACGIFISVLFWIPLVGSLTRAIAQLTRATERIADGQFEVTVDTQRNDELGRLGAAINRMASRLGGLVSGQKRFLGDTAHELCTPIARMNVALEILDQRVEQTNKPYVDDVREEAQEMSALVNELLSFSKASFDRGKIKLQPVCLAEVVAAAIRRESVPEVEIRNQTPPELQAQGNPELLQRAVANLLRNAVRYAGQAGPITVSATAKDVWIELEVSDQGPGVPEGSLPKLFDPFYRVDTSRTRDTGGIGLGLTIVKTCVESCGGCVSCQNRKPAGFVVRMTLAKVTQEPRAAAV